MVEVRAMPVPGARPLFHRAWIPALAALLVAAAGLRFWTAAPPAPAGAVPGLPDLQPFLTAAAAEPASFLDAPMTAEAAALKNDLVEAGRLLLECAGVAAMLTNAEGSG